MGLDMRASRGPLIRHVIGEAGHADPTVGRYKGMHESGVPGLGTNPLTLRLAWWVDPSESCMCEVSIEKGLIR